MIGAPKDVVEFLNTESTLSAVDLAMLPHLLTALDELVLAVSKTAQDNVALSRYFTRSYFNLFGKGVPPSFLDLGHLAQMLAVEGRSNEVFQASKQLRATLEQVVIAEKHGSGRPGSTGITIYFPNSTLYGAYDRLPGSNVYTALTDRFASQSLWDDFLLYHYTGAPMPDAGSGSVAFATENADIVGPGSGQIEISPIYVSSDVLSMEEPIFFSTEFTGDHIAQVFIWSGLYNQETNEVTVEVETYVNADVNKETNGVVYPSWLAQTDDGVLTLASEINAESLVITDGTVAAFGTFTSEEYGSGNCFVIGIHTSAATGEQHPAIMRFNIDSTKLLNMYVLSTEGFPIEYEPQPGDQFTLIFKVINRETGETSYVNGDTLTFGEQLFYLDVYPDVPGLYLLGLTIVDLDGNLYEQYVELTVE
jgi:hypothetical protein